MFCFPLTLTHGSSVCIRVHFNSHISVGLTLCALFITPVIIVTLIIVMSVGRASSVRNCFFVSFFFVFLHSVSFAMEVFITYVKKQPSHSL